MTYAPPVHFSLVVACGVIQYVRFPGVRWGSKLCLQMSGIAAGSCLVHYQWIQESHIRPQSSWDYTQPSRLWQQLLYRRRGWRQNNLQTSCMSSLSCVRCMSLFVKNCLHFLEGLGQTSAGFRTALTNCCIYRLRANSASPFSKSLLSNISAGCTPRPTHSSIRKHTSRLSHPYARAHTQINTPSSRNEYSHIQYTI